MSYDFLLQILSAEYLAAPKAIGFQVVPYLFIWIEFRAVRRQKEKLQLATVTLLALFD